MYVLRYLILALLSVASQASTAAQPLDIQWTVINRFPLFKDASAFQAIENRWAPQDSAEAFLAKAAVLPPEDDGGESWRRLFPIDNTLWNPKTGLYDRKLLFVATHPITVSLALPGQKCTWTVNGRQYPQTDCNIGYTHKDLKVDEEQPFHVSVTTSGGKTLSTTGDIESDLIIGLGDSFSSGEGNPDHPTVWKRQGHPAKVRGRSWLAQPRLKDMMEKEAEWWDLACHRSLLSWQALFALSRAVKDPHRVVRYASFACTGAEVYDGFFRAQIIPAGRGQPADSPQGDGSPIHRKFAEGLVRPDYRDGGWGSASILEQCYAGNPVLGTPQPNHDCPMLRYSQLNSLTLLLCDDEPPLQSIKEGGRAVAHTDWNEFYGTYDRLQCRGRIRIPSHVLLSFGGNDVAFARVVQWAITPDTAAEGPLKPLKESALNLVVRKAGLGVQNPEVAAQAVKAHLPQLYSDLNRALTKHLRIPTSRIFAMTYPNPLPRKEGRDDPCVERVRGGNEALGQMVKASIFHLDGWVFGIEERILENIDRSYIQELRHAQNVAFENLKWTNVDSQLAFEKDGRRMSLCAVTKDCETALGKCPKSDPECASARDACRHDRYAVDRGKCDHFPEAVVYTDSSEWLAYDPVRARGVRTAWDAAMAQMRYPRSWIPEMDHNPFRMKSDWEIAPGEAYLKNPDWDWQYGTVHPTANVHARIADSMASLRCLTCEPRGIMTDAASRAASSAGALDVRR